MTNEEKLAKVKDTCFGKYRDKKDVLSLVDKCLDFGPGKKYKFMKEVKGEDWPSGEKILEFYLTVHGEHVPYGSTLVLNRYDDEGGIPHFAMIEQAVEMSEETFRKHYYVVGLDRDLQKEALSRFQEQARKGKDFDYYCSYPAVFRIN